MNDSSNPVATVNTPAGRTTSGHLTKNQLLIWMDQQMHADAPKYNMFLTFTIEGQIDLKHFRAAFTRMIELTDALRTVVEEQEGIPAQRVLSELEYEVEFVDLSQQDVPEECLKSWLEHRCRLPLRLHERVFDSALVKLAEQRYVWFLNQHHIAADGWSSGIVYRRLAELYRRSLDGTLQEAPVPPQFASYVAEEAAYRQSKRHAEDGAYWSAKLENTPDPSQFYGAVDTDRSVDVRRVTEPIGIERARRLQARSQERGIRGFSETQSRFHIFIAVLAAYVHRVTGSKILSLGAPLHNRMTSEMRDVVGLLMEVCPMHIEIDPEDSFRTLIRKAAREVNECIRHCRYSPGNPLQRRAYDVMLNYITPTYPPFCGLKTDAEWGHTGSWDGSGVLAIQVCDFGNFEELALYFDFNCGVFNEWRQQAVISHFMRMLDAFLDDPDQRIAAVGLLSPETERRLLVDFNATREEPARDPNILEQFEEQVTQSPTQIAVVDGDRSVTYAELAERVERLAKELKRAGLDKGELVALCLDRSLELIVGMLGILRAGGGYVPMDPQYPVERLQWMLEDTGARFLATTSQAEVANALIDAGGLHIVLLDSHQTDTDELSAVSLDPVDQLQGDLLAYVIYTSGSTGRPKGVMIERRAMSSYADTAADAYAVGSEDRVLQFASISFDTSVEEIYPTLMRGGTLRLRNDAMLGSATAFLQTCRDWNITVLNLPTAYWHELVRGMQSEGAKLPLAIRLVIIGGERAVPEHVATWRKLVDPNVRLVNTYGPTETTVVATMAELSVAIVPELSAGEVPIGRPIRNMSAYVLDANRQPVPVGIAGELHIGGVSLARGYLNDQERTAERFIENPFAHDPSSRLYRTGDLCRFRPEGDLEFVGRVDDQIKIRGYRVELREIEKTLLAHPDVEGVVVLAQETAPQQLQLIAYVVAVEASQLAPSELRSVARQQLPDYMVPAHYHVMDAFPLSPNGKVDRRALPRANEVVEEPSERVPPRTATEESLAEIWCEVLDVPQVGIHDNFLELGGHSLLAVQVASRIQQEFGVDLPLPVFFAASTLEQMAAEVIQLQLTDLDDSDLSTLLSQVEAQE